MDTQSKSKAIKPAPDSSDSRMQLGRYSLYHVLGRGGMATVYLGRLNGSSGFERWVAIKRVHEHLIEDEEARRMFLDEARTAARLQHPNLVQVTDFGSMDERPYLVMEYVNGETLSALIRTCMKENGALPIPIAARIMAWACDGLHHAHELKGSGGKPLGVIHRDVSPQNILISYDGTVKVTDFGIAKAAGRLQSTRTGQAKGKLSYMSPEQALAQPLDRRSDIFSLGIVLYEATVGRRLFKFDSELMTLQKIAAAEFQRPREINPKYPEALENILLNALQQNPEDRYPTAREMQHDLERYLSKIGRPVGTSEVSELMDTHFSKKRHDREQMMLNIEEVGVDEIPTVVEVELSPSTLSLPGSVVEPIKRSRLRGRVIIALAAVLALTIAGVLWLTSSSNHPSDVVASSVNALSRDGSTPSDSPSSRPLSSPTPATATPDVVDASSTDGASSGATDDDAVRDAQPLGETEADVDLAEGPTKAEVVTQSKRRTKGGAEGARERRAATKRGAPGSLSIIARPWCDVYLGSKKLGRTPIIRAKVPSGRASLRFLPLGKGPAKRRSVTIVPDQHTPVSVDFSEN